MLSRELAENGYTIVDNSEMADFYIVHSCTVTALAEKKARQSIRHFKKINPDATIGVLGCYVQLRGDELQQLPEVDFIADNEEKYHLHKILNKYSNNEAYTSTGNALAYHHAYSLNDRTRSFLKVQDGCDYFCTYCAVAYARGRSRSNTIEQCIGDAKEIVNSGIREIVLTGVNVGDFGKGTDQNLLQLLAQLQKINGLTRLRLSSIEPNLLENSIIELVSQSDNIMPHFHIPLQSGSDSVLNRMKRRYSTSEFRDKVLYIKSVIPDACIAADVIVGFPGETDEEFEQTCSFIKSLPLSYLHVFTYSDRPDTVSWKMKPKVTPAVKQQRSKKLHSISQNLQHNFYQQNVNSIRQVLFEEQKGKMTFGWTDNYIRVKGENTNYHHNDIVTVRLNKIDTDGSILVSNP